jgi:hypothetical protein
MSVITNHENKMLKYFGNFNSIVDCQELVLTLEKTKPDYLGPRHKLGDPIEGLEEIVELWKNAGLKTIIEGGTIGWDMYFPVWQFEQSIVDQLCNMVNIDCLSSWISCIRPGYQSGWHWDANDKEHELKVIPNMERYHCNLSIPDPGHILIVGNDIHLYLIFC